jgi:hypothetical protein
MAKRFTDTEKWNDDWYISLSNDYRIIWQWLLDNCNHAGICKRSIKLLNLMCYTTVSEVDMVEKMDGRVLVVDNKWFIPKFLKFQYSTLHSKKPAIVSAVAELEKHNLLSMIPESFGNDYLIIKDKDKDKDKDNVFKTEKNKNHGKSKPETPVQFRSSTAQGQELWSKRISGDLSEVDDFDGTNS